MRGGYRATLPPVVIMILILLAYAVLGMFMDAIGMLLLTLPSFIPLLLLWVMIRSGLALSLLKCAGLSDNAPVGGLLCGGGSSARYTLG